MDIENTLKENFHKVVEYIKATYPNAMERSKTKEIECASPHHVYHTCYLVIADGNVYLHHGSHGWRERDEIYNDATQTWNDDYYNSGDQCCRLLESFLHEWGKQKEYINMTLAPYEKMVDFQI